MFGIGFTEIMLISIIAILFLGPDKLPDAMVQMAKFIKSVKKTIGEAKSSLEEEMKISDLKDEALKYKAQLDNATKELKSFKNIDFDDITDDISIDKEEPALKPKNPYIESKKDTVTFKKKSEKKGDA